MSSDGKIPYATSHWECNRLSVANFAPQEATYLLTGYPLLLSYREGEILSAILRAHPVPVHARQLAEQFHSSEGQISVQIHRINEKAQTVSGRKLVIGMSHHGFSINPYM